MYHPLFGEIRKTTEEEQLLYQDMLDKLSIPMYISPEEEIQEQAEKVNAGMASVGVKAEEAAQNIFNCYLMLKEEDIDWIENHG